MTVAAGFPMPFLPHVVSTWLVLFYYLPAAFIFLLLAVCSSTISCYIPNKVPHPKPKHNYQGSFPIENTLENQP